MDNKIYYVVIIFPPEGSPENYSPAIVGGPTSDLESAKQTRDWMSSVVEGNKYEILPLDRSAAL